jgi:UDP-N-acetylglucosamine 2-epimerase (non-hydrolysing)
MSTPVLSPTSDGFDDARPEPTGRRVLALIVGTRPEAIKVAPVALAAASSRLRPVIIATGQHDTAAHDALAEFDLRPDIELQLDRGPADLQADLFAALLPRLQGALAHIGAAATLVQGDTASALAGALAGVWQRSPVVHLEAGLRSFDRANPYPEETYRCAIGALADLHLAPTLAAQGHLIGEGVGPDRILCIGNTIVDAGLHAAGHLGPPVRGARRRVVVTVHRRENWGEPLDDVLAAIHRIVEAVPDVEVVIPVHPNPAVGRVVRASLEGTERVVVLDPLGHRAFLELLASATLVLTDSGGVQEEAPTFGVPALVLRRTTERPEAVEAGAAELVGTGVDAVAGRAIALLADEAARLQMAATESPFGDGASARRAVEAVEWILGLGPRPRAWVPPVPTGRAGTGATIALASSA